MLLFLCCGTISIYGTKVFFTAFSVYILLYRTWNVMGISVNCCDGMFMTIFWHIISCSPITPTSWSDMWDTSTLQELVAGVLFYIMSLDTDNQALQTGGRMKCTSPMCFFKLFLQWWRCVWEVYPVLGLSNRSRNLEKYFLCSILCAWNSNRR